MVERTGLFSLELGQFPLDTEVSRLEFLVPIGLHELDVCVSFELPLKFFVVLRQNIEENLQILFSDLSVVGSQDHLPEFLNLLFQLPGAAFVVVQSLIQLFHFGLNLEIKNLRLLR